MKTLLVKSLVIPAMTDDDAKMELGEITVTDEGITWNWNGAPIFKATWEQWALMMSFDPALRAHSQRTLWRLPI